MNTNGSQLILIDPHIFKWIPIDPIGYIPVYPNGSQWIQIGKNIRAPKVIRALKSLRAPKAIRASKAIRKTKDIEEHKAFKAF